MAENGDRDITDEDTFEIGHKRHRGSEHDTEQRPFKRERTASPLVIMEASEIGTDNRTTTPADVKKALARLAIHPPSHQFHAEDVAAVIQHTLENRGGLEELEKHIEVIEATAREWDTADNARESVASLRKELALVYAMQTFSVITNLTNDGASRVIGATLAAIPRLEADMLANGDQIDLICYDAAKRAKETIVSRNRRDSAVDTVDPLASGQAGVSKVFYSSKVHEHRTLSAQPFNHERDQAAPPESWSLPSNQSTRPQTPDQPPFHEWDFEPPSVPGVYIIDLHVPDNANHDRHRACAKAFTQFGFVRLINLSDRYTFVELNTIRSRCSLTELTKIKVYIGSRAYYPKTLGMLTVKAFLGTTSHAVAPSQMVAALAKVAPLNFAVSTNGARNTYFVIFANQLRIQDFDVRVFVDNRPLNVRFEGISLKDCGKCKIPHPSHLPCDRLEALPAPNWPEPRYETNLIKAT